MDQEMEDLKRALLESIREMKAGEWARKTVFEQDGGQWRRVSCEEAPPKSETSR